MSTVLVARLRLREGALVRVVRLLERRCHRVLGLDVRTTDGGTALEVRVTVDARLPPEVLASRLHGLYDVETAYVEERREREVHEVAVRTDGRHIAHESTTTERSEGPAAGDPT